MDIMLKKSNYISGSNNSYINAYIEDETLASASGQVTKYAMLGALTLNLAVVVFCSGSICLLLPLFNLIQLISLLPLLQANIPQNLKLFINNYLMFAHFNFDFLYNPLHKSGLMDLSAVNYHPFNKNFEENNITSRAFLVNYGGGIIIWIIIGCIYLLFNILNKFFPKITKFQKIKNSFEYAVILTTFLEGYSLFSLFSLINFYEVIYSI